MDELENWRDNVFDPVLGGIHRLTITFDLGKPPVWQPVCVKSKTKTAVHQNEPEGEPRSSVKFVQPVDWSIVYTEEKGRCSRPIQSDESYQLEHFREKNNGFPEKEAERIVELLWKDLVEKIEIQEHLQDHSKLYCELRYIEDSEYHALGPYLPAKAGCGLREIFSAHSTASLFNPEEKEACWNSFATILFEGRINLGKQPENEVSPPSKKAIWSLQNLNEYSSEEESVADLSAQAEALRIASSPTEFYLYSGDEDFYSSPPRAGASSSSSGPRIQPEPNSLGNISRNLFVQTEFNILNPDSLPQLLYPDSLPRLSPAEAEAQARCDANRIAREEARARLAVSQAERDRVNQERDQVQQRISGRIGEDQQRARRAYQADRDREEERRGRAQLEQQNSSVTSDQRRRNELTFETNLRARRTYQADRNRYEEIQERFSLERRLRRDPHDRE